MFNPLSQEQKKTVAWFQTKRASSSFFLVKSFLQNSIDNCSNTFFHTLCLFILIYVITILKYNF